MNKVATLLACVLALTCTMAMAQKRIPTSRTPKGSPSSGCMGPTAVKGVSGPQTCKAISGSNNASSSTMGPGNGSMLGRIANQKLGKGRSRPGTPDFLPASNTASSSQLP